VKIESNWFTITKETLQKIVLEVQANNSGTERGLRLFLSEGDRGNYIMIYQSDE
jgi:hypothetical protein